MFFFFQQMFSNRSCQGGRRASEPASESQSPRGSAGSTKSPVQSADKEYVMSPMKLITKNMAINKYNKSNLAVSSRNGHSIGVPHNTRVRRVQMVVQHHLGMGA